MGLDLTLQPKLRETIPKKPLMPTDHRPLCFRYLRSWLLYRSQLPAANQTLH